MALTQQIVSIEQRVEKEVREVTPLDDMKEMMMVKA